MASGTAGGLGFVHLRVHSVYSLLEGALSVKRLAELAAADDMPALGIADTGNLFGALEFAETMAGKGIQPLIGCALAIDFGDAATETRPGSPARDDFPRWSSSRSARTGYGNLVRLVSELFLGTDPAVKAHVTFAQLEQCAEGLAVLTGGPAGRSTGDFRRPA